ncbi:MAG: nucleotide exchange factor GrpE [Desulfobacteraceae bacterium]|nr:MAG: nucleotide exchange factor GrpE [Desulfobacteraceae bacterium]
MNSKNTNSDPDDNLIPDDSEDETGDSREIEAQPSFDNILEIGIPINETLNNLSLSNETSGPAEVVESPSGDSALRMEGNTNSEEGHLESVNAPPQISDDLSGLDDSQPLPDDDSTRALGNDVLEAIKLQIDDLAQAFNSKLKYDEHKNKIIDDLHQGLQQHREGLLKKYLHRIVMDVIKIVDDMRKLTAHYNQLSHSEDTSVKLLKYIENIATDLEDVFSWEGVVPFTCGGDIIDPARQRVLNRIATDDPEKDKTIAERLRPGYEWDGKIIRPEMVSVYIFQTNSPSGD